MAEMKAQGHYHQKSDFIDRKIEFDQRFFNTGYREFQSMISDVRAQINLNEEIIKMRKIIKELQE